MGIAFFRTVRLGTGFFNGDTVTSRRTRGITRHPAGDPHSTSCCDMCAGCAGTRFREFGVLAVLAHDFENLFN